MPRVPSREIGNWGFIDKGGKIVIGPTFNSGGEFHSGFANASFKHNPAVFDNYSGIIDKKGRFISQLMFKFPQALSEGKFVVQAPFQNTTGRYLDEGEPRNTYIDTNGQLFSVSYSRCGSFCSGRALVAQPYHHLFLIDKTGKRIKRLDGEVVPGLQQYTWIYDFSESVIPLRSGGLVGFWDTNGNFVIKPVYQEAKSFRNGFAAVAKKIDGKLKWGFIDKKGKLIIACKFDDVGDFYEGVAKAQQSIGVCGYIGSSGEWKFKLNESFKNLGDYRDNLVDIKSEGATKFLDHHGRCVFRIESEDVGTFHEDLCFASVTSGSGYTKVKHFGFLDKSGKWRIKPIYLGANNFSEGLAAVCFDIKAKSK